MALRAHRGLEIFYLLCTALPHTHTQNSQDKGQTIRKEEGQHSQKLCFKSENKKIFILRLFFGRDCAGCQVTKASERLLSKSS